MKFRFIHIFDFCCVLFFSNDPVLLRFYLLIFCFFSLMPSYIFVVAVVLRPLEQHIMMPVPLIFESFISIYVKQHKNTFFLLLLVFKIVIHN